jgi:hypothetical protein
MHSKIQCMAHSFLVFDFGGNEEAAQQARHRIDGWRQAFRLDKKLQLKFDRGDAEPQSGGEPESSSKSAKGNSETLAAPKAGHKSPKKGKKEHKPDSEPASEIRLIVRLDFSDHEKLSHQRWLARIPSEEPFKAANPKVILSSDPEFATTDELFDSLNLVDGSVPPKY